MRGRDSEPDRLQPRRTRAAADARGEGSEAGEIPRHQRFYYLELLRRAGLIAQLPAGDIRITPLRAGSRSTKEDHRRQPRCCLWNGQTLAAGAIRRSRGRLASARGASLALFGSRAEQELCEQIARNASRLQCHQLRRPNHARAIHRTGIPLRVFLTNDSGAMHIASALGVPTVAIFGATDDIATGPTGPRRAWCGKPWSAAVPAARVSLSIIAA